MAKSEGSPKTTSELAAALGFDHDPLSMSADVVPFLLTQWTHVSTGRMLRHLCAMGYIIQTGVDEYKPTNFSKALTIPLVSAGYPF